LKMGVFNILMEMIGTEEQNLTDNKRIGRIKLEK
jgi:hypothetical protein